MKQKKLLTLLFVTVVAFAIFLSTFNSSTIVEALSQDQILSYFSKVGDAPGEGGENGYVDYVKSITYGDYDVTAGSGSGVMVTVRNKSPELVNNEENDNNTNPMLLDFPSTKYAVGAKLNQDINIADNTADDSLIEIVFPGENDNWQTCGLKVVIEDSQDPTKYIALFIWRAYSCTLPLDASGLTSIIASAAGTWEKTDSTGPDVYIHETGFDYINGGEFRRVGSDLHDGSDSEVAPKDGCYLNSKEYGHNKTNVRFSRLSQNSFKIQFDYETGILYINGVLIRHFRDIQYSADGQHVFDGFSNGKVKLSVGYVRSTRMSTDEFTKFCIASVDKHANVIAPQPRLIESGNTELPKPTRYSFFEGETIDESPFTVNVTDPDGVKTNNYSNSSFTFDKVGTYNVEYLISGSSIGSTQFVTAVKDSENKLVEVGSFKTTENLFYGKELTLKDFILKTNEVIPITSANVSVYKNGALLRSFENVNSSWKYAIEAKGDLTFRVSNDKFTLETTSTVRSGICPASEVEHGSVMVNGANDATTLFLGANELVITPDSGYRLKSLKVLGVDVTSDVFQNTYTVNAETIDENITYEVVFEALPTYNVTFKANNETISTVSVFEGTTFKDIDAPTIPEKEGYDVVGWSIEANSAITSDVIAEAQYKPKTYTIIFNSNGGTQFAPRQFTSLETVDELPEAPVKEGYTFIGWYLGDKKFELGSRLTEDIVLTAKYSDNNHQEPAKKGCKSSLEAGIGIVVLSLIALSSIIIKKRRLHR